MTTSPVERAADQFVTALAQWRVERGMTKKQLAARMGFDPSYVSHVEGRRHKPTEDFARRAEAVLGINGVANFGIYVASKHAVSGLTKSWAGVATFEWVSWPSACHCATERMLSPPFVVKTPSTRL